MKFFAKAWGRGRMIPPHWRRCRSPPSARPAASAPPTASAGESSSALTRPPVQVLPAPAGSLLRGLCTVLEGGNREGPGGPGRGYPGSAQYPRGSWQQEGSYTSELGTSLARLLCPQGLPWFRCSTGRYAPALAVRLPGLVPWGCLASGGLLRARALSG
ncbi:type III endosome membrane protein TEMP isoform X1 [Pan paniscus]|uniref:type III endosome membrane protein TEMP isoform X1 n=1 Tax=Pan paniscus TaxID=9597 RepID=UPI001560AEA6